MSAIPHDSPTPLHRPSWLPRLALLGGLGFAVAAAWAIALRIGTPFALEVMEDGMAAHALRVRDGLPLYVEPSAAFVPYLYGPVFHWLGAGVLACCGESLAALRAIALASTGYVLWALFAIGRGLAGRWAGALAAVGFAATYFVSATWFDLARIDLLHLAFLLASYRWLERRGRWPLMATGLALAAVFTKQSSLGIVAAMAIGLAFADWRRAVAYAAGVGLGTLALTWLGDAVSDGWFSFYLFELPAQHAMLWGLLREVFADKLAIELVAYVALTLVACVLLLRGPRWRAHMLPLGFAGACLAVGCMARLRDGGWYNVMIPAHAGMALLGGTALVELDRRCARRGRLALAALLAVQAVLLAFDHRTWHLRRPADAVPSAAQRRAGRSVLEVLRRLQGDVYAPSKAFALYRAGKPMQAAGTAVWDVRRGRDETLRARLDTEVLRDLGSGSYRALLLNAPGALAPAYPVVVPAFENGGNAHTAIPVPGPHGLPRQGYEQLYWHLRAGDREALELIEAVRAGR